MATLKTPDGPATIGVAYSHKFWHLTLVNLAALRGAIIAPPSGLLTTPGSLIGHGFLFSFGSLFLRGFLATPGSLSIFGFLSIMARSSPLVFSCSLARSRHMVFSEFLARSGFLSSLGSLPSHGGFLLCWLAHFLWVYS